VLTDLAAAIKDDLQPLKQINARALATGALAVNEAVRAG
jgi:hypothetical protein